MSPLKAVKVKREIDYDERLERRLKRKCISNHKTKGNASTPNNNNVIIIDGSELDDDGLGNISLDDGDRDGDRYKTSNGNSTPDKNNVVGADDTSRRDDNLQKKNACLDDYRDHGNASMKPSPKKEIDDGVDISKLDDDLQKFLNLHRNNACHDDHSDRCNASTRPTPGKKIDDGVDISKPEDDLQMFSNPQRDNACRDDHIHHSNASTRPTLRKKIDDGVDISNLDNGLQMFLNLQRNNACRDDHSDRGNASTKPTHGKKIDDGVYNSKPDDDHQMPLNPQRNNACRDDHIHHGNASRRPTSRNKIVDGVDVSKLDDDPQVFLNPQGNNACYHDHSDHGNASTKPTSRKKIVDGVDTSKLGNDPQMFLNPQRNYACHDHSDHGNASTKPTPGRKIVNGVDISKLDDNSQMSLNHQRNSACHDDHNHHGNASTKPTSKKRIVDGVDILKLDDDFQMLLNGYSDGNRKHTRKGYPSTKAVPNQKDVAEAINISEPDDKCQMFLNGYHGGDRSATFIGHETGEPDKDYLKFLNIYCDGNTDARTMECETRVYPDNNVVAGTANPEIRVYPDDGAVARTIDHDICVPQDDVFAGNADPEIHNAGGSIGDLEDPQYKLFLQKLRVYNKSYVLEVEVDDGITLLLKYECEEFNSPGPENVKTSTEKDKVDVGPSITPTRKNKFLETVKESSPTKRSKLNEESARQMCTQSREPLESFEQAVDNRQQLLIERDAGARDPNFVSAGVKKCWNLGQRQETIHCSEDEESICDESYATFLHCLRSDGEVLIFNHHGERVRYGENSDDEEEEGCSSDVMIIDKPCFREPDEAIPGKSIYSAINLDDDECGKVPRRCCRSNFREKLVDALKKPYDAREHADLLRKITFRRPKTYVRRLRNGMEKAYPAEGVGKSYLDQYTDLAEKLRLVKENQYKTLTLLRGFFYWLKNLPYEGVFRPWLDPACLSVLPSM